MPSLSVFGPLSFLSLWTVDRDGANQTDRSALLDTKYKTPFGYSFP